MTEQLKGQLNPVRVRQHRLLILRASAVGLLIGSGGSLLLGLARWWGAEVSSTTTIMMAVAGMLIGFAISWLTRPSWKAAAFAVDNHYQLKDRSLTALHFSNRPDQTDLHRLQIHDAIDHMKDIDAKAVAPFRMPRMVPVACAAFGIAVILTLVPSVNRSSEAKATTVEPHIVQIADELEETMLDDLEEVTEELAEEQELGELVEELKELLDEMKEPGVDQREALAKLSEMQNAIAAVQAEFNMDEIDAQMAALGESVATMESMKAAASALQKGDYEKASEKLEEIDPASMDRKAAKTVSKDLRKLAKQMSDAGLGQLSDATSEFCEGLETGEPSRCKGGACKLAGMCRKFALRKAACQCMGSQLAKLSLCKGACQGNKNGGKSASLSNSPSNSWGTGSAGNPLGDKATRIDSTRNQENVRGMAGEGPSEREVTNSPEGRQTASREYRENYEKHRKATEEVLEGDALPLGHRQTIRRYFESIHPDNEQAEAVDAAATN